MEKEHSERIKKQWYALIFGETVEIDNNVLLTRVPGGWIWRSLDGQVFIPFTI